MLQSELVVLADKIRARQAEMQTVEVKAAHKGCPEKLRDTLSSFSNQDSGGTIVRGRNEWNETSADDNRMPLTIQNASIICR